MNQAREGVNYFLSGFSLINRPGLRRFVVIPILINCILFVGFFFLFRYFFNEWNEWFITFLPGWLHWLAAILWLLFFMSFLLLFIYTFVTTANLIAAPFYSLLAEKVEAYLTGIEPKRVSWADFFKDIPRILKRQLAILSYYLSRTLLLCVLFFIPVLQMIAGPLWVIFNAWMLTLTYLDYPTDNHRIPLDKVKDYMRAKPMLSCTLGMCILTISIIPLFNLIAIPAAVASATKLWVHERRLFLSQSQS